jgi:predicted dithiol-disulfide oxidoreductase (DUF899 family)
MSNYKAASEKLASYRREITTIRQKMRALQETIEPEPVQDYELSTPNGPVRLSQLFGDKDDLFVVHNMGAACPYCTLWADGYNGIYQHIANRAAFVLASPDAPEAQKSFAASRGWRFPMVSHAGTSFAADMGYRSERGWMPGISVFQKRGDEVVRVSDTGLKPGDDFCSLWHMLDMLPEGSGGWAPKFKYG